MLVEPETLARWLTRLQLTAIRDQLDSLLDEAARQELTLRETLAFLCQREIARKDERRIAAETAEHHSTAPTRFQGSLITRRWRGGGIAIYQKRPPTGAVPGPAGSDRHVGTKTTPPAAMPPAKPKLDPFARRLVSMGPKGYMERRAAMERSDSSLTRHNADEEGHGMAGHATRPKPSPPRAAAVRDSTSPDENQTPATRAERVLCYSDRRLGLVVQFAALTAAGMTSTGEVAGIAEVGPDAVLFGLLGELEAARTRRIPMRR
jgi:hypothetical protein